MKSQNIKALVDAFVRLIVYGESTAAGNEASLTFLLSDLERAVAKVEYNFDGAQYPDPPEWSYEKRRALTCERFPRYGYYNAGDPGLDLLEGPDVGIGDAIDDIADIAGDLYQVAWRWENTSQNDALFDLQSSHEIHWGEHLRSLQRYLKANDGTR